MSKSPDAFRTISEVADWLGIQAHVLRFWESKFTPIKPIKRAGGRRYYRPADMLLLGGIKRMLHEDGLTIKGVQKVLREEGMNYVAALSAPLDELGHSDETEDANDTVDMATLAVEPVKPESVVLPFESARPTETAPEAAAEAAPQETPPEQNVPPQDAAPVTKPETPATDTPAASEPVRASDTSESEVKNTEQPVEKEPLNTGSSTETKLDAASDIAPQAPADVSPAPAAVTPEPAQAAATPGPTAEAPTAEETPASVEPSTLPEPSEPDAPSSATPAPSALKPRIVDVVIPSEADIPAVAGTLSSILNIRKISPAAAANIAPVLSRLTALRDSMASGVSDHSPTTKD
ncbi:MAG: MerR family transcriptional regulator [Sulfitobacter sp.]|nr:MerR family transcriptional regulator [Sulfitobacter sp.]